MTRAEQSQTSLRAAKGTSLVFASQVSSYAIFLLCQRTVLSTLSKEDNGTLALLQQFCSITLLLLADSGWNNVAMRESVRQPQNEREILATAFWMRCAGTLVAAIIMAPLALLLNISAPVVAILATTTISLSGRSSMLRSTFELPLRTRMNFKLPAFLSVLDVAVYYVLLQFNQSPLNAERVFTLLLLSSLPGLALLFVKSNGWTFVVPFPRLSMVRELLRDIKPMAAQMLYQNIHSALDLYILQRFAPLREVGVYGAVSNTVAIMGTVYASLSATLYPAVVEAIHTERGNAEYRIMRSLYFICFVMVTLASALSVSTPLIISLLTKDVYAGNVLEFQLQFWCMFFIVVAQTAFMMCSALNLRKAMALSGLTLIAGSLSIDFFLIPQYHTAGMMGAKIWSNVFSGGVALWFIAQSIGTKPVQVFVWRLLAFVLLNLTASAGLSLWVAVYLSLPLSLLFGITTGWFLGFVGKEELNLLGRIAGAIRDKLR